MAEVQGILQGSEMKPESITLLFDLFVFCGLETEQSLGFGKDRLCNVCMIACKFDT